MSRAINALRKPIGQGAETQAAQAATVSYGQMVENQEMPQGAGRKSLLAKYLERRRTSRAIKGAEVTLMAATTLGIAAACASDSAEPASNETGTDFIGKPTFTHNGETYVLADDKNGNGQADPGDTVMTLEEYLKSLSSLDIPESAATDTESAQESKIELMQFENEAAAQRWAVDHLAGDEAWLQDASHWHLTQDGGLVFDIPSESYGKEHVDLNMSSVKDQVMVQGYRNIWHDDDDAGVKVTRDAYVVVGEDSFYFRQATVWVADQPLTPEGLSKFGNEGYEGQVKYEATMPDQADVEVHAVGFNPEGFQSCEIINPNNPVSHLNVPEMPATEEAQKEALQAFANAVGTDAYTRNGANYRYIEYGGIVLREDPTPGVHHRINLSNIANNVVIQTYQDVRLDGTGDDGWMRDAIVWTNDQKLFGVAGENRNGETHQMFVRRATFWGSVDAMNAAERTYNGQVAYYQQLTLEKNDPTQIGVVTHPFGFQRPEPSPAC